jgi:hypothetical protein
VHSSEQNQRPSRGIPSLFKNYSEPQAGILWQLIMFSTTNLSLQFPEQKFLEAKATTYEEETNL